MGEGNSWSQLLFQVFDDGVGEKTEEEKEVGVAWQLLSLFHRQPAQPRQG